MADAGQSGPSPSEAEVFGTLRIGRRVLETPSRTIAIRNIAAVSVGVIVKDLRWFWGFAAGIAAVAGAIALAASRTLNGPPVGVGAALLAFTAVAIYLAYRSIDRTHYLIVASNDGTRTLFTGPSHETLHSVRSLLSRKINENDEASVYNVDFEAGTIQNLSAGGIPTDAILPAAGSPPALPAPGARPSPPGDEIRLAGPPAFQAGHSGQAHRAPANAGPAAIVDYQTVLPTVEQLREYYTRTPGHPEIQAKLEEIAGLMRLGTPSRQQRSRVSELAADLGNLLKSYASLVPLFQHIRALAGS